MFIRKQKPKIHVDISDITQPGNPVKISDGRCSITLSHGVVYNPKETAVMLRKVGFKTLKLPLRKYTAGECLQETTLAYPYAFIAENICFAGSEGWNVILEFTPDTNQLLRVLVFLPGSKTRGFFGDGSMWFKPELTKKDNSRIVEPTFMRAEQVQFELTQVVQQALKIKPNAEFKLTEQTEYEAAKWVPCFDFDGAAILPGCTALRGAEGSIPSLYIVQQAITEWGTTPQNEDEFNAWNYICGFEIRYYYGNVEGEMSFIKII